MELITRQDLEKLNHHKQILFACFCAEQVIHLVAEADKPVCLKAIQTAYLFLEDKATQEECRVAAAANAAAYAAASAASAASASTAYAADAAYAAYAAYAAAYAAPNKKDKAKLIEAQWAFYDQLLNGDKYFEEIVLEGVS